MVENRSFRVGLPYWHLWQIAAIAVMSSTLGKAAIAVYPTETG